MLEIVGVTAGYGRTMVLFDVDVSIPVGGGAAVMGHNGAGKTTLLRVAVGLIPVEVGQGAPRRRGRHQAAAQPAGASAASATSRRASSASRR